METTLNNKLNGYTNDQLMSKLQRGCPEEEKHIVLSILKERGQNVSKWDDEPETTIEVELVEKSTVVKELNKTQKKDLLLIDPRLLKIEQGFNTRFDYGDIDELKNSIIENGVRVPLRGYKEGEFYFITDGHRRLEATLRAIQEGNDIARVPFSSERKRTLEERIFDIILSNDGKQLTPLELGETYRRLMQFGFNYTEIAKKIGKTIKHVSDMVSVAESSKELKDLIKEGNISASLVAEVKNKVKNDEEAEEIMKTVSSIKKESSEGDKKKEKVTKKDVEDLLPEPKQELPTTIRDESYTFTEEETKELLKRQIKACAKELPLAFKMKVLQTPLVIE